MDRGRRAELGDRIGAPRRALLAQRPRFVLALPGL